MASGTCTQHRRAHQLPVGSASRPRAWLRGSATSRALLEMMFDATQNYAEPLSDERLFAWHAALFSTGRSGMRKIIVGAWRDDGHGPTSPQ